MSKIEFPDNPTIAVVHNNRDIDFYQGTSQLPENKARRAICMQHIAATNLVRDRIDSYIQHDYFIFPGPHAESNIYFYLDCPGPMSGFCAAEVVQCDRKGRRI